MSRRQQRARHARRKQANAKMRALGVAGGVAVAALGAAVPAQADQTFTVTTTADSGTGSLRDAITQANANPGNDRITFASGLSGEIDVQSALPTIGTSLDIEGPGPRAVAIDGSRLTTSQAVLYTQTASPVVVAGLTVKNAPGIGIRFDNPAPTLRNVAIDHNGLGVEVVGDPLTVDDSTLTGNTGIAGFAGGAIHASLGHLVVSNSTITGNSSTTQGGAIYEIGGDVTLIDSTVTGNAAPNGGGGVEAVSYYGTDGDLTLQDSVVSGNTDTSAPGPSGGRDVQMGAYGAGARGALTSDFSLIGADLPSTTGTGAASAVTLDAESTALFGQDPRLGALENNGGATDTEAPLTGSPLLDAGQAFGLTTDQRGAARPTDLAGVANAAGGDGSDIGAVEVGVPVLSGVSPSSGAVGSTVTISGAGLSNATGVSFGIASASFTVLDDGDIRATVPNVSGTADVRVTTPGGQTSVVPADRFTVPAQTVVINPPPPPARPTVSGLSAHSGSSGLSVKISGAHLGGATAVKFGSVKAHFKVLTDGTMTATVPSNHGRVDVTVTGPGGTSATGAADRFSYLVASVGHHSASAKWKGSSVVVDSGLSAACPRGGDRCTVSVKAVSSVPASLARVRRAKTKSLTLGSSRFHVSAGKKGEVTFTLTRKGLKALQKLGKLKITVTVSVVDGSVTTKQSRTITVRLPKKPKLKLKKK